MAKSSSKSKATTTEKAKKDVLGVMKNSGVTKASAAVASTAKNIAKAVAPNLMEADEKNGKKDSKKSKKSKKEPTPEPESSSESESESDSEAEEKEVKKPVAKAAAKKDDSSSEEDSDSDDSSEDEAPAKKAAPAAKKEESSDSESDSDSDEEEEEKKEVAPKTNGTAKAAKKDDSDSSDSDSTSGSDSSDEEMADAKAKAAESSDSDSDSSDSDSDDEPAKKEPEVKKRKADAEASPAPKKAKTETEGGEEEGTKTLFVGRLSWDVDEEWLAREFSDLGAVSARIVMDRDSGRSKGYGYIDFSSHAEAVKALELKQGVEINNRPVNLDLSNSKPKSDTPFDRAAKYGDSQSPPTDTLFIGNLSFDADEETLSNEFSVHGEITSVRIPTDRETGNKKGFAYVTFTTIDEAKAANEAMNGAKIAGRAIRTDFSQPRSNDGGGRGGGRGGSGGFGGGRGGGRGGFGGGRGGGRGGFGGRGGGDRGRGGRGGRGGTTNRGGFGDFKGKKTSFD